MNINQAVKLAKELCPDPFARRYLDVIPDAIEDHGYRGFLSQLRYALSNMNYWRGNTAKEVKATIKNFLKENTP